MSEPTRGRERQEGPSPRAVRGFQPVMLCRCGLQSRGRFRVRRLSFWDWRLRDGTGASPAGGAQPVLGGEGEGCTKARGSRAPSCESAAWPWGPRRCWATGVLSTEAWALQHGPRFSTSGFRGRGRPGLMPASVCGAGPQDGVRAWPPTPTLSGLPLMCAVFSSLSFEANG